MKKPFQIIGGIFLVLTLFSSIAYYQLSLQKIQQDHQIKVENLNQKIAELENQIEESNRAKEITKDWKMYKNEEYKFGFKYPNGWRNKERKIEIQNYFVLAESPDASVLEINLLDNSGELSMIAESEIVKRNCPPDRIISQGNNGVLYATHCGASTEKYIYIFKNKNDKVIQLSYHDDFKSSWSEEEKLEKFNLIISTISLF